MVGGIVAAVLVFIAIVTSFAVVHVDAVEPLLATSVLLAVVIAGVVRTRA